MGMSKARRAREEAGLVERTKKGEEAFQQQLKQLDAAVDEYDEAVRRWDKGCAGGNTREKMMQASVPLHENLWFVLMEFYRRNRKR